ncbi:MAG: glycosyltransferase family 4 protein, partial [Bacteroidia bacterium]|nr:glycosyltransferase family 4 protein [Bacteroidia bacterium]
MPKLLVIGFVWPEPKSSAAGSRMLQLIDCFKQLDYSITFASACAKTNNAFNLESIHVAQEAIQLNNSSFNSFIKDLNPEVVLFDRFMTEEQFGWRVTETCPHAIKILDTEDLHCLRKGRHQALKDNKPFDDKYLFNDFAKREIASIYRCDLTLMISEVEIEILKEKFKVNASLLLYLPFLLDELSETQSRQLPDFQSRTNFMTIGNFLHEPNYDAILYLKQDIWPLIKKNIAHAELHIYGAYQSQKATQLNNENEGFIIKGFAEDVYETLLNYRVNLAALRFGAGLKGKLTDAMISGTPCLMTSIAA